MKKKAAPAASQMAEMEAFFVGDFSVRKKNPAAVPVGESKSSKPCKTSLSAEMPDKNAQLLSLAEQIDQCRKCGIGKTRLHSVPGQGCSTARLVFVGEAPGADEDEQGLPFVGRAGQLLEKMIVAMGLKRQDVFICNTLKCRPPDNRDPKPDEIANCMPYLKQQLEIIQPQVIVALGAHAARTLLQTEEAIGKLRGVFHTYSFSQAAAPAKLMPTYHPAYLLRNYSTQNRARVWEDLKKVVAELGIKLS